jgi:hypothetical protein
MNVDEWAGKAQRRKMVHLFYVEHRPYTCNDCSTWNITLLFWVDHLRITTFMGKATRYEA